MKILVKKKCKASLTPLSCLTSNLLEDKFTKVIFRKITKWNKRVDTRVAKQQLTSHMRIFDL